VRARDPAQSDVGARAPWRCGVLVAFLAACAGSGPARREPPAGTAREATSPAPRQNARATAPDARARNADAASATAGEARARPAAPPFKPAFAGALYYAAKAGKKDVLAVPKDRLRAGILKDVSALARREKHPRPQADARLDAAMNDLAHNLRGDDLPALEVVDFLLTHYGITEPSPHLLLSRATAGADREIREQALKEIAAVYKADPVARVGIGVDRTGDLMYVVVGLQETHVALEPVPRHLARGAGAAIEGKLIGRYREARVVVTSPDGKVAEQEPSSREGHVRGQLACAAEGKYQVEVTAEDTSGTAVLANFPVYCGVEPPAVAPRGGGGNQTRGSV
jgi:hypothetical protein